MYAIVEIAGQQFKVEEGLKIYVHRLEAEEGKRLEFNKVLLVEDEGKIIIGEPFIKDFAVEGTVLNDKVRGDKVIVFKKKRRKGYRVRNGHRQDFTQIEILHIGDKKTVAHKKTIAENQDSPEPKPDETKTTEEIKAEKQYSPEPKPDEAKTTEEIKTENQYPPEPKPDEAKTTEEIKAENQYPPEPKPDEAKTTEEIKAENQDSREKND